MLFFIALAGVALGAIGTFWQTTAVRDREADLLFIGEQFQQAIRSYYESSPEATRVYPKKLEDLVEDRRLPAVRRHLRRIYRDPFTREATWGLARLPDGGITGVYSLAVGVPQKVAGFPVGFEAFEGAASYREWVFDFKPSAPAAAAGIRPSVGGSVVPSAGAPSLVVPAVTQPRPPSTPVVAVPAEPSDETKERCNAQLQEEIGICQALLGARGAALLARCIASANARSGVCLGGTGAVPPPLFDGAQSPRP